MKIGKIGFTERGDGGIDLSWATRVGMVDGVVVVTKNLTDACIREIINCKKPVIVHCTCTGFGGTALEPCVPTPDRQLTQLKKLIDSGFPVSRCVLRVDPIIPTEKGLNGLKRAYAVIQTAINMNLGITRIRISILDMYKHVRERFAAMGWPDPYGGSFYAPAHMMERVLDMISYFEKTHPELRFQTCAEDTLVSMAQKRNIKNIEIKGCLSLDDLFLMGLSWEAGQFGQNPQGRNGCHCLSCKTELLEHKKQCPHGCVYCYWRG